MKAEELFTGHSLESWLPAGQRNQQPFPLCQCHFFVKNVSVTPQHGELRVLARRERALYQKKGGGGSPMACKFGKTLQPLSASSLLL